MNDLAAIKVDKYLYWPHQLVGQGSFATVYRGKRITDNLPMAVKKIKINEMGNRINKLWSEIKIMKQLSHINILKLYDVHLDMESEVVYLFLEWCQDGDLSQVIKLLDNSKSRTLNDARKWDSGESKSRALSDARTLSDAKTLSESQIRTYFRQIRAGLEYLHQQNILHRDLKPQNILLNNGQVKICDFGLSILADQNSLITTMCGSPMYMAPEVIRNQDYTTKADLWSLGVILYELIYGRHPYPVTTYPDLMTAIDKPIKYPLDRVISDSGTLLLKGLLEPVVGSRLDWSDFFNHAWFQIDLDNTLRRRTGGEYKLDASVSPEIKPPNTNRELFYSFDENSLDDQHEQNSDQNDIKDDEKNELTDPNEINEINDEARTNLSGAIAIRPHHPGKNFDLSQYIVKDYSSSQTSQSSNLGDVTGQSAPVTSTAFGQSYSPRLSFNSVGSQVYKCLSKSYNVLKKNL